jgi:hypothetical protein
MTAAEVCRRPSASAYAQADRAVAQVTDGAKGLVLQMMAEQRPKAH